jgi:hypothetical protein
MCQIPSAFVRTGGYPQPAHYQITKHFVGAATARDVRSAIGARYLGYEVAFASAHSFLGVDQNVFRGGLNEKLVTSLSSGFLANDLISSMNNPGKAGCVELKQATPFPTTWEFADGVTAASLKDILGQRLLTGSVVASIGPVSPQITKVLVKSPGPFVALVDQDKVFVEICDRYAVVESVAREAIDQTADA